MNEETSEILRISYNIPNNEGLQYIEISKKDKEYYTKRLREVENELANKKATNIVYTVLMD